MTLVKFKAHAFAVHLGVSVLVVALAAILVFFIWYPFPFRELSGGRELFLLIAGVDVVLGPLITFIVFNPKKSRCEKWLDLSVIGLLQIVALGYGLLTVYTARPVHVVFEYNRFRVVHAADIPLERIGRAPSGIIALPVTGPTWLSLRPLVGGETVDYTLQALNGVPVSAQPELWRPYDAGRVAILTAAHPVTELQSKFPMQAVLIKGAIEQTGLAASALRYLPIQGRRDVVWTVLLDGVTSQPLGFIPLDSF